jgi:lysozyme family protein
LKGSWPEALAFTFKEEGYDSQLKGDPGGPTYLGISSHYWPKEYAEVIALAKQDKAKAREYAANFYYQHMWQFISGDSLPHPLDVIVFDSAVNPGPTWAVHTLAITQDPGEFLAMREQHYRITAEPEYLHGLLNRCLALRQKYNLPKEE